MAIYSAVPPPEASPSQQPQPQPFQASAHPQSIPAHPHSASGTLDIEAWTISALESLSVSPIARGPGAIPLDDHPDPSANAPPSGHSTTRVTIAVDGGAAGTTVTPPRRPPSRRDSMRRREALLKGKEGSRQRRRWDMKRLIDVPNIEPPEPEDWLPRPVYPVHHIPYQVASYWDRGLRQQVEEKNVAARKKKTANSAGKMPRDLRDTIKRTPGIKGWVRTLEEPVRHFLAERDAAVDTEQSEDDESDVSDDEVVFVGRKATAQDRQPDGWKKAHREVHDRPIDRGMIFDSLEDDESGAFKYYTLPRTRKLGAWALADESTADRLCRRWLTHSISDYYGLDSRSVTMGNPARRCVYIGIREADLRTGPQTRTELPRPLWEMF